MPEGGELLSDFLQQQHWCMHRQQVNRSDSRDFVAGTFIWSGFDYLGEARGWPQNTKCRGTVSDVAGFTKETAYWIRSWWLSNIPSSDAGKPPVKIGNNPTLFIVESWNPPPSGTTRSINVYTNLPSVKLQVNGKDVRGGEAVAVPYFGQATFPAVTYSHGVLTAIGFDATGKVAMTIARSSPGTPSSIVLSLDAPSITTGTGSAVLLDGEDVALVRASLLDSKGDLATNAMSNITFSVVPSYDATATATAGVIWATHNGDPANTSPSLAPYTPAYHGLARAFVRTTVDHASSPRQRRLMRLIDAEGGTTTRVADPDDPNDIAPKFLTVKASSPGLDDATIQIPLSTDPSVDSPVAAARASVAF
jgi:beta-galactosidase